MFTRFLSSDEPTPITPTKSFDTTAMMIGAGVLVVVVVALMVYRMWGSESSSSPLDEMDEDYNIELPPESAAYDELRKDTDDEVALKKALLKRAVAMLPIHEFIENEEKRLQGLYRKSMVNARTMQSFQNAATLVTEEMTSIVEEAKSFEEEWGERIWAEAQFLFHSAAAHIRNQRMSQMQMKQQEDALKKAKKEEKRIAEEAKQKEERQKRDAEKLAAELIRDEQKEKQGLTQRKKSGGKNKKKK